MARAHSFEDDGSYVRVLHDQAAEGAGDGGQGSSQEGAGSALGAGQEGAGQGSNTASQGTPQEGRGDQDSGQGSSQGSSQSVTLNLEDMKPHLPESVQNDNDLMSLGTVDKALEAYKSARQAMSMNPDEIVKKPSDPGDLTQLQEMAQKLGAPASADEFTLENPKDSEGNPIEAVTPDQELSKEFAQKAHEAGLMPKQAQELFNWFGQRVSGIQQQTQQQTEQQVEQAKDTLRKEWGEAFDSKMSQARIAVEKLGGKELMQTLEKTGAANSPDVIRALAQVGGMVSEDGGLDPNAQGSTQGGRTPAQLRSEAKRIEEQAFNANSSRERRELLENARQMRDRAAKFG